MTPLFWRAADVKVQPKVSYAAGIKWFSPDGDKPNDTEVLFFALLVISARESAEQIDNWAKTVLEFNDAFTKEGVIPPEWAISRKVNVPKVYKPLYDAYKGQGKSNSNLDQIGKAISNSVRSIMLSSPGKQLRGQITA